MMLFATFVTVVLLGLLVTVGYIADRLDKKSIYVYKGNQYFYKSKCLMKDPKSRMWITGIIYVSLKSGELFVREENDFLVKFETYKQWKKNGRNDKGSRR